MPTVSRPAAAWQEPFDAIPVSIQARDDLGGNAKRLYAALSSAQRMDWRPTYADLAERLGASPRSIVRWVAQLVGAGLIAVRRRGQGLANLLTVLALVTSGSASLPLPGMSGWQRRPPSPFKRNDDKKLVYTEAPKDYYATREGRLRGH